MWGRLVAAALVCCLGLARGQLFDTDMSNYYNPCVTAPTGVLRGDPFVFGVSFWPGYTINNWGPAYNYSDVVGLNPCLGTVKVSNVSVNYNDYLNSRGAVLATYALKVDTMAVLRVTKAEMDQLWDNIPAAKPKAMSMIAFRGNRRSEARYSASNEAYLTQGTGIAQQTALLAVWDNGNLQGFEWFDFQQCQSCGGIYSDRCLRVPYDAYYQRYPQTSCAASFSDCACRGLGCVSGNCTTAIYVAHRGTDRKGAVMQSAYQFQQLNSYSVTGWFSSLWQKVDSAYDNSGNIIGNGGEPIILQTPDPSTAQAQFVNQQTEQIAADAAACGPGSTTVCLFGRTNS